MDHAGGGPARHAGQRARLDASLAELGRLFGEEVAAPLGMEWRLGDAADRKRIALLASRHDHALLEVLWNWRRGDLRADVTTVVSNHPELRGAVEGFGVPFLHVPNTRELRARAEARMLEALEDHEDVQSVSSNMDIAAEELERLSA